MTGGLPEGLGSLGEDGARRGVGSLPWVVDRGKFWPYIISARQNHAY